MGKIFWGELQKVFLTRSTILIFVGLLILNGFLLYKRETSNMIQPQSYVKIYNDLVKKSPEQQEKYLKQGLDELDIIGRISLSESGGPNLAALSPEEKQDLDKYMEMYKKGNYLLYTDSIFKEENLYSEILDEFNQVNSYEKNLKKIISDAQDQLAVSIFSTPGTFSHRNISKTSDDMKSLLTQKPELGISNGINMATEFVGSDLIVTLLILFICLSAFLQKKRKVSCS